MGFRFKIQVCSITPEYGYCLCLSICIETGENIVYLVCSKQPVDRGTARSWCMLIKEVMCNWRRGKAYTQTSRMAGSIAQLYHQLLCLSWPSPQVNQSRCAQI